MTIKPLILAISLFGLSINAATANSELLKETQQASHAQKQHDAQRESGFKQTEQSVRGGTTGESETEQRAGVAAKEGPAEEAATDHQLVQRSRTQGPRTYSTSDRCLAPDQGKFQRRALSIKRKEGEIRNLSSKLSGAGNGS